jgi:allantoicase
MEHDFRNLPDLAVRTLGGSVVWANDESFAERQNLILPGAAQFDVSSFGHRGKVYDGWETRRRREPGTDAAIVRLGAAGVVRGVVIDTAWFKGNYPPEASVEAASVAGHPSTDELLAVDWQHLVARTALKGDSENAFAVSSERRWTHVRLSIHPDGGVARLRVHGDVVPDPALLGDGVDLAALENGGLVVGCSNMFYSSPNNLISPGLVRTMGEGWETARRRDDGNDWVSVRLVAEGVVHIAELDTSYFLHNAPGAASLRGRTDGDWFDLLPRTALQPDTRHRFVLEGAPPAREVRLDVYPDGGMARLRLFGSLTDAGRGETERRWYGSHG